MASQLWYWVPQNFYAFFQQLEQAYENRADHEPSSTGSESVLRIISDQVDCRITQKIKKIARSFVLETNGALNPLFYRLYYLPPAELSGKTVKPSVRSPVVTKVGLNVHMGGLKAHA